MIGQTISHYRILDKIGEGGMGVVYRATDTKLNREVAIKVLPEAFARDHERMARFEREAHLLASMNHPHIASIYGLEEQGEVRALAMELVEGPTLAGRIAEGAIPLEEALPLAQQTAEALEYAHEHGIVHRDLKPANVKVTEEGTVKLLDFGVAKAMEDEAAAGDPEHSPTLTAGATKAGVILGTAAYMSPEQARGKTVDKRADIWAFGVVLYEMLTGKRLFEGETISDTLACVLKSEIDFSTLPNGTPSAIRKLLRRCLERDRKRRLQAIGDARIELEEASTAELEQIPQQVTAAPERRLPWVLLAATAIALLALAFVHFLETPLEAPLRRFAITPTVAVRELGRGFAISPNGRHIAFVEEDPEGRLWVQDLDQERSRAMEGTEGSNRPFWSPDSDFIGFAAGGELRKVPVRGGPSSRVCELPSTIFFGGTWSPDGEVIVFSSGPTAVLYEVLARGGTPNVVISPEEPGAASDGPTGVLVDPHFLPSEAGPRVLVFAFGTRGQTTLMVQDLESGQRELLSSGGSPSYSPSGHIVYNSSPALYDLWALPFSLDTLQATGEAFPIAENSRFPAVATDGTLVYLGAPGWGQRRLVWLDRDGEKTGEIDLVGGAITDPRLSPDGRLVAYTATEGSNTDVWVYEIARGVRTRVSTAPETDYRPVWSPDGKRLAFSSLRSGNADIVLRQADGTGEEIALTTTRRRESPSAWSRNGKYLLCTIAGDPETGVDLCYLERTEDGSGWELHPLLQTPSYESVPRLSPDDRYVAYVSRESGRSEVCVLPFPEGNRRWTVSSNGGTGHRWSRDGKELFYIEGSDTLMTTEVSTEGEFSADPPIRLFQHPALTMSGNYPPYDVSLDGQLFLVAEPVGRETAQPSIRVVQNWFAEFRDRQ